jgi:lysophospholipid acyltransferase
MGYLNFLPTSLIGPPLEYNDYQNFMEFGEVYSSIPSVFPITVKTLGETILFGVLHIVGDIFVPLSPLKTDEFYSSPLWYILLYSTVSVYLIRCKYYFGWKLSMSAVHASGVSFNGKDFKRINTIDPWVFESSMHVRDKINNWNISVQEWLRKAIYLRSPLKNKTANQLYVFVVSAFWHGIYSAYYISEVLWFVQLHLQTLIFKYFNGNDTILNRLYAKLGKAGTVLLALIVTFEFSHNSTYFLILEGEYCWKFMQRMYFVPELGLLVLIAVFTFLPGKKKERSGREVKKE